MRLRARWPAARLLPRALSPRRFPSPRCPAAPPCSLRRLKQQIRAYSDNTTAQTIKDSDTHQHLMIRLQQSQGLIEQLGIQVHHQEGSA
jgi:hypothetical protein